MEIIAKGHLPEETSYRVACSKCQTLFRFLKRETTPSPDQRDVGQFYIVCPLPGCKTTMWNSAFVQETSKNHVPNQRPPLTYPPGVRGGIRPMGDSPNYYRDH